MQDDQAKRQVKLERQRPRGRPKSRLCDLNEVARYLHVSRATIYRLLDRGLPCLRVGWVLRFDLGEVLAWLRDFTSTGQRAHWTDEYAQLRREDRPESGDAAPPHVKARYRRRISSPS